MQPFTWIFLIVLTLMIATRLWLNLRQSRHVRQHRGAVPDDFAERISLEEHQKAADYTLARARLSRINLFIDAALLLVWTLGGGLQLLDSGWRLTGWNALYLGTAVILSAMLIMSVLELPATIYQTFVLEARFGFNRTTPGTFIADRIKGLLLTLVIGTPLILLVLWLMSAMGNWWWIYVWAVWLGFSLFMAWAWPTFIAPLFNRFKPLEDETLRKRVADLLQRCGFTSRGVYVMDGSRRSGHGNAYFTGLGRNKRIVFFDTLLDSLKADEIEAVLAHELGHFKRRHIIKSMVMMALVSLAALALLAWLMRQPWFYTGLGVETPSLYMALLLFIMVGPVFGFFLNPLFAWRSRRHEFEADEFAAEQTDGRALIRALVQLYRENASTLTPDPLHSIFYDSHPPAAVRIQHLNAQSH
ncbi:MAG: M48 family metallopeptidase [Gammaproteobacteria bacterium]|jgi:STE24 endopeptidase